MRFLIIVLTLTACISSSSNVPADADLAVGTGFCPVGDECPSLPLRQYGDKWLSVNYPTAENSDTWTCHSAPGMIWCTRTVRVNYLNQSFECTETEEDGGPSSYYCYLGPDLAPHPEILAGAAMTGPQANAIGGGTSLCTIEDQQNGLCDGPLTRVYNVALENGYDPYNDPRVISGCMPLSGACYLIVTDIGGECQNWVATCNPDHTCTTGCMPNSDE